MKVLMGLEPAAVFDYFEQICEIPHGSGNVDKISDYLVAFAKEQGLFVVQDEWKNVIIIKEATEGYENEPAVILQGHMDMVAVKTPDSEKDMTTEGLELVVEGDNLFAKNTSLGGDDGIAVAYSLALLASKDIPHPRLEVVLTVDEEVGMDGARMIDVSMLQGKRMVNLDSEEEGIFLTSCAGGARVAGTLPMPKTKANGLKLSLKIDGLQGGHSGAEIHKERGNANCIMGRVLHQLAKNFPIRLVSLNGGLADNAIPRLAECSFIVQPGERNDREMVCCLQTLFRELSTELQARDPGVHFTWKMQKEAEEQAASVEDTKKAAALLVAVPNGVQGMSMEMKGLVETSLNLGIVEYGETLLKLEFSVRSSVESKKHYLIEQLITIIDLAGGTYEISGDYPGWQYQSNSPLRDKMEIVFEKLYGKKPSIEAIHAGVECGFLVSKIPGLDCVSIGPDMKDIHTTEEVLSISSTKRVWKFLLALLEMKEL